MPECRCWVLSPPAAPARPPCCGQSLACFKAHGLRVGAAKQARDDFDIDQPGKDSYRLRKAGVERLLLTSSKKWALILEHPNGGDPELNELLLLFDRDELDIILVEGFSDQAFPKIELVRGAGSQYVIRTILVLSR